MTFDLYSCKFFDPYKLIQEMRAWLKLERYDLRILARFPDYYQIKRANMTKNRTFNKEDENILLGITESHQNLNERLTFLG